MKKFVLGLVFILAVAFTGNGRADEAAIRKELEMLKDRIEQLEQQLEQKEAAEKEKEKEVAPAEPAGVMDVIQEKIGTLSLHGGIVAYYQGATGDDLNGQSTDDPSGAGIAGDLELTYQPAAPILENGEFYIRLHGGEGTGADQDNEDKDNDLVDVLFANLNTIADDNADEEDDSDFRILEAHYTQAFFDGMLAGYPRQDSGGRLYRRQRVRQ